MTVTVPTNQFARKVAELREMAQRAESEQEMREIISRIAQIARVYRIQHGIGLPMNPVEQAQELFSGYSNRPHIAHLSERITNAVRDVERGQNRLMAVSMPPRAGKSTLISYYSPLWMLRRHPEWRIIMTSYDGGLTTGWARDIRNIIEDKPELGIALKRDGGAGGRWSTIEGGGMYATSTNGSITGRGARVFIIDDPVKDFVEAHSDVKRKAVWNWWLSVALTRLEPPYLVLVVMCMTGDTPVLRPDGTETPLRDIRPGDEIATFTDDGEVTTSVVSNWASQGVDDTFAVHLASGRVVRANARHPFWVIDANGEGSWVRLGSLQEGMKVRCLTALTEGSNARQTTATSPRSARACACPTTPERAMPRDTAHPRPAMRVGGRFGSKGDTASRLRTMIDYSLSRMNGVLFAGGTSARLPSLLTGRKSSALTTTTTLEPCEDCSATTATSSLLAATRPRSFGGPLSTSLVSTDEIISIVPSGREEVFDIEVVGTHRFIANGLDVSNTRWHEDDFVGRLLSSDYEGDPRSWEVISLPAIAEREDALGREEGEPLLSPLVEEGPEQALERWDEVKRSVGNYTWSAMYQQRPAPAKGAIFDAGWWRYWSWDPEKATEDGRVVHVDPGMLPNARWLDSWDTSFKGATDSDWVVGQRWVRSGANRYLVAQLRGRWSFTQTLERMQEWALTDDSIKSPYGRHVHERFIESTANGPAIMDVLHDHISGLKPVNPRTSKEARARAITPEVESGNVYLPHPSDPGNEWVADLLNELRNFPHDSNDDQVDALTQALNQLRDVGKGQVTVPGRVQYQPGQGRFVRRDITAAAKTDRRRW